VLCLNPRQQAITGAFMEANAYDKPWGRNLPGQRRRIKCSGRFRLWTGGPPTDRRSTLGPVAGSGGSNSRSVAGRSPASTSSPKALRRARDRVEKVGVDKIIPGIDHATEALADPSSSRAQRVLTHLQTFLQRFHRAT